MKNIEMLKNQMVLIQSRTEFYMLSLLQFYSSMTSEAYYFLILQNYIFRALHTHVIRFGRTPTTHI